MIGGKDETEVAVGERDAAPWHAAADLRLGVERASGDRVDEQRPARHAEFVAFADRVTDHGHLRKPRLHQPAVGEARRVVVGRNLNVDVEAVSLADTGR